MLKSFSKAVKNREYNLYLNGKTIKISTKRIKGVKEYYASLMVSSSLPEDKSFFIYNEFNFASFGMSDVVDLVFANWDGKIIHIEESFKRNKISKKIDNVKFIYILPKNTVFKKSILMNDVLTHQYNRRKK